MSDIEHILAGAATDLAWLSPPPVFVGGATIGLFLDDFTFDRASLGGRNSGKS